jgi:hypothetical protein
MYDEIIKSVFIKCILPFLDWDETGDINGADTARIICIISAILMTPHGIITWQNVIMDNIPTDITFFSITYDVLSMIFSVLIVAGTIVVFIDICNELKTIKLYKYR